MIIPWLLSGGWRYAIMGALLLVCGVQRLEISGMKAAEAEAQAEATTAARDKDNEIARLARDLDAANIRGSHAIDEAADAARALARSRGLYVRARCNLPATAGDPGISTSGAAEVRLSDDTSDWLIAFAKRADQAALYAQTCHAWALKIGR